MSDSLDRIWEQEEEEPQAAATATVSEGDALDRAWDAPETLLTSKIEPSYDDLKTKLVDAPEQIVKLADETGLPVEEVANGISVIDNDPNNIGPIREQRIQRWVSRRQYKGLWDEFSRAWVSMSDKAVAAGLQLTADLGELGSQMPSPYAGAMLQARPRNAQMEATEREWAQRLYEDATSERYEPGQGGGFPGFVAQTAGQIVPFAGLALTAGLAGGPMGAFGVSAVIEGDDLYRQALATPGVTEDQAQLVRVLGGSTIGLLEVLQLNKMVKFGGTVTKDAEKNIVKEFVDAVAQRSLKKVAVAGKRLGVQEVTTANYEGFTEVLQEWAGEGSAILVYDKNSQLSDMAYRSAMSYAGGAVGSFLMSPAFIVFNGETPRVEGQMELAKPPMVMSTEEYAEYAAQEAQNEAEPKPEGAAAVANGAQEAAPGSAQVERPIPETQGEQAPSPVVETAGEPVQVTPTGKESLQVATEGKQPWDNTNAPSRAEQYDKGLYATSILEGGEVRPGEGVWRSMGPKEFERLVSGEEIGGLEQQGKKGGWFSWYPARAAAEKGRVGQPKYLVEFADFKTEGEAITQPVRIGDVTGIWKSEGGEWQRIPIPKTADALAKMGEGEVVAQKQAQSAPQSPLSLTTEPQKSGPEGQVTVQGGAAADPTQQRLAEITNELTFANVGGLHPGLSEQGGQAVGQSGLFTAPTEEVRPDHRQSGQTTLIPDLAAEIAGIVKTGAKAPANIASAVVRAIHRNLRSGVNYFATLGEAGQQISKDVGDIAFESIRRANNDEADLVKVFDGLSDEQIETLSKTLYPKTRRVAVKDEETGKTIGHKTELVKDEKTGKYKGLVDIEKLSPDMQRRAKELLAILDRSMNQMAHVGGLRKTKEGQYVIPTGMGFAYPNSLNELGQKIMKAAYEKGRSDAKVFQWAEEQVEAGQFKTVDEAILALQNLRELSLRGVSGYLERSRIILPEPWIDWNAKRVLPNLVQRNWLTVEAIRRWGYEISIDEADPTKVRKQLSFPSLRPLIEQVRVEFGRESSTKITEFVKAAFLNEYTAPEWARTIAGQLRSLQFISKVGSSMTAIVRNMLDRLPKAMAISIPDTARTLIDYPPFISSFIKHSQDLHERMVRSGAVIGSTGLAEDVEPGTGLKNLVHRPYASSEAGNQAFEAAVSYRRLMRDITLAQEVDPQGVKRTFRVLTGSGVEAIKTRLGGLYEKAKTGQITADDIDRFLHDAVLNNAYPMILSTKPVWWDNHPFMRVLGQFKVWPLKQTKYIWDNVLKYTVKTGDPTRLLGFLLGTLIVGEMYKIVRDILTDRRESVLLGDKERVWSNILNDLVDGGVVGMLADFTYGIYDWAKGPTVAMIEDISTAGRHVYETPTFDQSVRAARWFVEKQMPAVRQIEGLAHKFDENENDITERFILWRARAWEWRNTQKNPTLPEQAKSWTEDAIWGREEYEPGPNTLVLSMASRQIVVGDIGDAAGHLSNILERGEDRKKTLSTIEASKTIHSPLGPIPLERRHDFLKSLDPEERDQIGKLQALYEKNYEKAIKEAEKRIHKSTGSK